MRFKWEAQRLAEYMRDARIERGLSLRELGRAAGVDFTWIGHLEKGDYEVPDPRHLAALAYTLGLNISDIFIEAGYPAQPALPSVRPYLRAKFDLPDEAAAEVERHIKDITARLARDEEEEEEEEEI
jgi:transcriptional regulator with XRE-family HTH domain